MSEILVEFNLKTVSEAVKCKLVGSIIDLLLYFRKQIPFNYEIFEKIIENKLNGENEKDQKNWGSFKEQRQKMLAKETLDSICSMKKEIYEMFHKNPDIEEVLILFGSTLSTSKESYLIKLPANTKFHNHEQPHLDESLRQVFLNLVQNEMLDKTTQQLKATNMYLLIKHPKVDSETFGDDLTNLKRLGNFKTPVSCHNVIIHLKNSNDFQIFDDFQNLHVNETKTENESSWSWYQSQIIVKGFNDILVNNKSIWN